MKLARTFVLTAGLALVGPALAGSYDDILVAAEKGDNAQVVDLLRRGMDVNTADQDGNTLLMTAARNANAELIDFLLRNRANPLRKNKFGDSALMVAAYRGHVSVVRRLLDAGASPDTDGWTALHYAAYGGHAAIVQLLAERNADPDAVAPNGQTALMLAAGAGHLEAAKALVEADADLDAEDDAGRTALMLADKNGHAAVAQYLRESGALED